MTNLWRLFLRLAPYPASAKAVKADPWDGKARRGVAIALPSRCIASSWQDGVPPVEEDL